MKAIRESRTIHLVELPNNVDGIKDLPDSYSITINYKDDENSARLSKAISLDSIIIPLILKALNTEE
jgi:hypothetical protein